MNTKLPPLTPLVSPWMEQLITDFDLQHQLFEKYGSPLNVHHIPSFEKNISAFEAILSNYGFKHKIFYARKANKCKILASAAVQNGIGVDTASFNELKQCLDNGILPSNLVSTAAIKTEPLLKLAIHNQVLLIIDNEDEANKILELSKELNQPAIIGFRISGFYVGNHKLMSRFGLDVDEIESFILDFFKKKGAQHFLNFTGFHFHLDGYSPKERGTALHQTMDLIMRLRSHNFDLKFIDIGGGVLMNYLENQNEWRTFQEELKMAVLNQREPITYNNNGLGFTQRNGVVEGQLSTYPFYNERTKEKFLPEVLSIPNENAVTVANRLEELDIELRLEPGRSLLDQVGVTMAKVVHRKKDARNNILVGLEMNMTQMASSSADFLLDPFISYADSEREDKPVEVYLTGAYCLERDVLLQRKIALPSLPSVGDVLLFVNTAGYMMHFFETEAHLFDLSQNVYTRKSQNEMKISDFMADE